MKIKEILEGKSVRLQPVDESSLDFICDEETDENLWKYEESVEKDRDKVREIFFKRIDAKWRYDYVILDKNSGKPVGACYVWVQDESRRSWEVGYVILPEYQRKGYCLDSVKTLIDFAFKKLGAHKVLGMCNANNTGSAKVMLKSGMKLQGVFPKEYLCRGVWVDQNYYSIQAEDYETILFPD